MLEADLGVESQSAECSPVLEPLLTWVVPPRSLPPNPVPSHPTLPRAQLRSSKGRGGIWPSGLALVLCSPGLCLYPPRNPTRSCTACSRNLLSCCKSLWVLRFLQRHGGGPWEEQPGAPPSEQPPATPARESVRTLPFETE